MRPPGMKFVWILMVAALATGSTTLAAHEGPHP